jgi:hypothetical protein
MIFEILRKIFSRIKLQPICRHAARHGKMSQYIRKRLSCPELACCVPANITSLPRDGSERFSS